MSGITGKAVEVFLGTTDLSAYYTDFSWKATRGKVERADVTSKADVAGGNKEYESTLQGDLKIAFTLKVLYEATGASNVEDLADGATGNLLVYPAGSGTGKRLITLASVIVNDIAFEGSVGGKMAYTISGYGYTYPVWSTTEA
jgi:hypothetical protein